MLQNSPLNVGKHAVAAVGSCLCVMTIHTLNVIEVRTVHLVGHVKHPYLAPTAVLMTQARLGRNSRVDVVRTGEGESTQLCTNDAAGLRRPLGGVHASFLALQQANERTPWLAELREYAVCGSDGVEEGSIIIDSMCGIGC